MLLPPPPKRLWLRIMRIAFLEFGIGRLHVHHLTHMTSWIMAVVLIN